MIKKFQEYVGSLDIDANLKKTILEGSLIKKHSFYINLVDYLSPLYASIEESKLLKLSFSSYLYFRFLVSLDYLLDNNDTSAKLVFFSSVKLFEESLKALTYLYPENSSFWKEFEGYKKQYFQTILHEKKLSGGNEKITLQHFLTLATGKSAVCYAIVSALNHLGGENSASKDLVECLKQVHIAFQYLDDIDDFRKDYASGQRTYTHELVDSRLSENGYQFTEDIETQKYKYLFVSGIATDLIEKAAGHYKAAKIISTKLGLEKLGNYINTQQEQCFFQKQEIQQLLDKTRKKVEKSSEKLNKGPVKSISGVIEGSVKLSGSYLINNLNENVWTDFLTTAGEGKAWITAYVGMMMAEPGNSMDVLARVLQNNNFNGSFNDSVMQDGDSTNFLVGFSYLLNKKVDPGLIKNWFTFMQPNGGWVTYNKEEALRSRLNLGSEVSVKGWMSPKLCVSAAAAYIMRKTGLFPGEFNLTAKYLAENAVNGYWASYWWTSPVYASAFSIKALAGVPGYDALCRKACAYLIKGQKQEGCWNNPPYNVPSAFYTALAANALATHSFKENKDSVESAVRWLIENQAEDGSWPTNRILLIPSPDVEDIRQVKNWRNSSFGTNIVVDDHNRVFTTATVLNTLVAYQNNLNN